MEIIVFIFGLIVGSFANSVIYRLKDIASIAKERSICPHCKKTIAWYDLVPLFSFVALHGRCRYCREKISWQYPLVELSTALIFLWLYLDFGATVLYAYLLILSFFLVVIFVNDIKTKIIYDVTIYPPVILWLAIVLISLIPGFETNLTQDPLNLFLGLLLGGLFIALIVIITKQKGMGVADIKLAALLGFVLGWQLSIVMLFMAFVIGAIVGTIMLAMKMKKLKSEIAFGPFLIIGFYIALMYGQNIINWYLIR